MATIKQVLAREILNSRGDPTLEARIILDDGTTGVASCPSGISKSSYEAYEMRDNDQSRFGGKGVLRCVEHIHKTIAPRLVGLNGSAQQQIDNTLRELDGTDNKTNLGANTLLAVSMACAKAGAKSNFLPLFLYLRQYTTLEGQALRIPSPAFNVINGGVHASNNLDMQEFLILPASFKPYSEALHNGVMVYKHLQELLKREGLSIMVGDEGAFGPNLTSNEDALTLIAEAIKTSSLRLGYDIYTGLDAAANFFHKDKNYKFKERGTPLTARDLITYYEELVKKFHIIHLEDPLFEEDWDNWSILFPRISQNAVVVGDDLTATNPIRLQMAINKEAINGIVIKPIQIGTVMEALAIVEVARASGLKITVSHMSGETNDDFIADFAVAVNADYVKFGAPARGERLAKYNRLWQIEQQIREAAGQ